MSVAVSGVSASYDGHPVLRDVTLRVSAAGWVGLIGPNGAGKTTLLRAIAGLIPFSGEVSVLDASLATATRRRLARLVAYVPQRPEMPAAMTVPDYVLLGRTPYVAYLAMESHHDLEVVARVLERLELTPLADRRLGSLSGGEGQRVILARALAQEAPVLLLDEPTAALDVGHQQKVLELVDELRTERGLTVISAMHDLTLAGQYTDELLLLQGGRVVASGSPRAVLTETAIARFYGASVRIVRDPNGEIAVVPARSGRRSSERRSSEPEPLTT